MRSVVHLLSRLFAILLAFLGVSPLEDNNTDDKRDVARNAGQVLHYDGGDCMLPSYPKFGKWSAIGDRKYPGEWGGRDVIIRFACDTGYKLSSDTQYALCTHKNAWDIDHWPTCLKKCPAVYSTKKRSAKCFNANNVQIPCDEAVDGCTVKYDCVLYYGYNMPYLSKDRIRCINGTWEYQSQLCHLRKCSPFRGVKTTDVLCVDKNDVIVDCEEISDGTIATFACEPFHELVAHKNVTTRVCNEGSWDLPLPVCQPICGEVNVTAKPLIVNGTKVAKGNYTWVAALYYKVSERNYTNVCGGSILSQKVILTAAHCVTNSNGEVLSKDLIMVGVGKYYSQYNHPEDTNVQYLELEEIMVPKSYKANSQRFASDIALLITKDEIELSDNVQHICYEDLPNIPLYSGFEGVVTGWGYTDPNDSSPSNELVEIRVPFKTEEECYREFHTEWANRYFTSDKMCAGHYNKSTSVCQGDSGGGLVFKNPKNNRYYIHGIVSIGRRVEGVCDTEVSALYTKVVKHYWWMQRIVTFYSSDDN